MARGLISSAVQSFSTNILYIFIIWSTAWTAQHAIHSYQHQHQLTFTQNRNIAVPPFLVHMHCDAVAELEARATRLRHSGACAHLLCKFMVYKVDAERRSFVDGTTISYSWLTVELSVCLDWDLPQIAYTGFWSMSYSCFCCLSVDIGFFQGLEEHVMFFF